MIAHNDPSHVRDRVLRLFEQHHIPANILVSLPSLEGIKRAVAMQMGVALLPRRCAESEIVRGELVALAMPEIRLRRQVRLVYRKGGERSHASTAFLAQLDEKKTVVAQSAVRRTKACIPRACLLLPIRIRRRTEERADFALTSS